MVEINDDVRGRYNSTSQIKFKISRSWSSLSDYSDACEPVSTYAGAIANFHAADDSALFKFKQKMIKARSSRVL